MYARRNGTKRADLLTMPVYPFCEYDGASRSGLVGLWYCPAPGISLSLYVKRCVRHQNAFFSRPPSCRIHVSWRRVFTV